MKFAKNKTIATLTTLILMITMIGSIFAILPITNAHTPPWTIPTVAYVTATPNPIGIGQFTTIVMWVDYYSPVSGGGQGQRWDGFKLEITKPDGSKETLGPYKAASDVGSHWVNYIPDQVGTYTIVFSWPGETATPEPGLPSTNAYIGDWFNGSKSAPTTLTVQQEPIKEWQEPPLPTGYWELPLNDANRGWSVLASNWLKGSWLSNNFQKWGRAPESAHVLWTRPITEARAGGINDAVWPGIPSDVNDYENPWTAPIIMNGVIYYNSPNVADSIRYGYYAIDLYTGKDIWYKNGTDNGVYYPVPVGTGYDLGQYSRGGNSAVGTGALTQGQLLHYYSVNGQGILSYLIMVSGTTWYFLDPATGDWMLTLINVPAGTEATDAYGALLRYNYDGPTGNLLCWNSSQSIPPPAPLGTQQQQWKMRFGATIDAVNDTSWTKVGPTSTTPAEAIRPRSGYSMNLTIQKNLPGSIMEIVQDDNRVTKMIFGGYMANPMSALSAAAYTGGAQGAGTADEFSAWLIRIDENVAPYSPLPQYSNTQNTNLGFGATLLWNKNFTVPVPGHNYTWRVEGIDYNSDIFVVSCKQLMQRWAYRLSTGTLLWGPTPPEDVWNFYGISNNAYYGKILSAGYSGTLYAYDAQTGKLEWTYNATSPGRESPYGVNMPLSITLVADGKVYLHSTEHSPTKPLWRESCLRCINITDGTELWKLLDYNAGAALADGYIVSLSLYDNNIYCIGKGPSALTVEAPMTSVTAGSSVVLQGTVTDTSPGASQSAVKAKFPNGLPAVSDADQQKWMEYIYEQQAMPTNAKGVEVTIDAIDPNNNLIHIGTATSDTNGLFNYMWTTPDIPGKYTIVATFAGSKSYGESSAETTMAVSEVQPTVSPYPVTNLPPTEMYVLGIGAAIIIAVAIVGAVLALMIRKRP